MLLPAQRSAEFLSTSNSMSYLRSSIEQLTQKLFGAGRSSPPPSAYPFAMAESEKELFDKTTADAKVYLEFGSGGSTIRVLEKTKADVYSVESSVEWIKTMREFAFVRHAERKRLLLFHADIGPTLELGRPAGPECKELFPRYTTTIFRKVKPATVDTVLIDGRFRVACAMKTILECHNNRPLRILIHDFWNREAYHIALKYLTETARAETLGVFAIKKDIDLNSVKETYEQYKYDPA